MKVSAIKSCKTQFGPLHTTTIQCPPRGGVNIEITVFDWPDIMIGVGGESYIVSHFILYTFSCSQMVMRE